MVLRFFPLQMLIMPLVDGLDFTHIESFPRGGEGIPPVSQRTSSLSNIPDADLEGWEPTQLGNGKWACNHKCKDKTK